MLSMMLILTCWLSSCSSNDDNEPVIYYPESLLVELGTTHVITIKEDISSNWTTLVEDEEVVSTEISMDQLYLRPQKPGKTVVFVLDQSKKVVFSCHVEVVKGQVMYKVDECTANVEIIDEAYKEQVEQDINKLHPFPVGTQYHLVYNTNATGDLTIYPNPDNFNEKISGTFTRNDDDHIIFSYDGIEEEYTFDMRINKDRTESEWPIDYLLIKDYTYSFREKYPDAGVYRARGFQVMEQIKAAIR